MNLILWNEYVKTNYSKTQISSLEFLVSTDFL